MAREIDCKYVEENNLVALYLAEALPEDTANAFERHYLGCDDCSNELQAGLEARTAFGPPAVSAEISSSAAPVPKGLPPRDWRLLAAAAAVGVVALAGVLLVMRARSSDPVATLAAAVGDELPIEARLSGKLLDRKPPAPQRGGPGGAIPRSLRLASDKAILEAEERPSARNLHAAGLAHLLLGELDEAVSVLKEASRRDSDPGILSDLSAAYSARGLRRGDHADFQNALQAADEALAKDPGLPAALYNNALAVEQIAPFAPEKIRAAWVSYLKVDPTSQWAEIARKHLKALPGLASSLPKADPWPEERTLLERALTTADPKTLDTIVSGFSQQSRIYLEEDLLPAWAAAASRGASADAARLLTAASRVGSALGRVTGNPLPDATVGRIRAALDSRDSSAVGSLAAGHLAYGEGQKAYARRALEDSLASFDRAESFLSQGGSPFAAAATLARAGAYHVKNDYSRTMEILDRLRDQTGVNSAAYPALAGRMLWLRGLTQLLRGYSDEALTCFEEALVIFERLRESENQAAMHELLAETLDFLGNREDAWRHRELAFRILTPSSTSIWLPRLVGSEAQAAMADGQDYAALVYLNFHVEMARKLGYAPMLIEALRNRGLLYGRLANPVQAARDLHEAREVISHVPDPSVRERSAANLGISEARVATSQSSEVTIRDLTSSLEFFQRVGNHVAIAQVLLERGIANRLAARSRLAETDLARGVAEIESLRERPPGEDLRVSYFANGQPLFEELISLLVSEGRSTDALDVAERARARALLDEVTRPGSASATDTVIPFSGGPVPAARIAADLPEGVAVIEYVTLSDRLLIWVLRRGGIGFYQRSVSRRDLEESVVGFLDILRRPSRQTGSSRAGLSRLLIDPIAGGFTANELLVFVPDKSLSGVPFSALQDGPDAEYLIEHHRTEVAPSATMFLRCAGRGRELATNANPGVLAVGNPSLGPLRASQLADLPHADEEASRVAGFFPGSEMLGGKDATKARFLTLAPHHGMIHFAGHSILNPRHPQFSSLLFAPDAASGETGILYSHEVTAARFRTNSLVFLSACATAAGPAFPGEGDLSIGRAFLAAGVPAVIGSLWPVGDLATDRLASAFYKGVHNGRDPVTALRLAQLAMLHSADSSLHPPGAWAPFELIGGYLPAELERTR